MKNKFNSQIILRLVISILLAFVSVVTTILSLLGLGVNYTFNRNSEIDIILMLIASLVALICCIINIVYLFRAITMYKDIYEIKKLQTLIKASKKFGISLLCYILVSLFWLLHNGLDGIVVWFIILVIMYILNNKTMYANELNLYNRIEYLKHKGPKVK